MNPLTRSQDRSLFSNLIVLELASVLAGPAVGMFFAELGATVIKVENPAGGGDVTRSWKLPGEAAGNDISAYFASVNWGKRSIALDLTVPKGRVVVFDLVRRADVVIASYKPGDDRKLGLDYPALAEINPQLIYGQISGYGADDPRTGYDAILQAACGFTYMNGEAGGQPVKMPVALIDLLAAHQLKEALLVGLIRRLTTGEGSHAHISLLQAGIASLANQATNWLVAGHVPERLGSEHPNIVPYGSIYRTADGKEIVLGVGNDAQFRRLCRALERPELSDHPDYTINPQRVKNRWQLRAELAEAIGTFPRDELIRALNEQKVPAGGILSMPEVFQQAGGEALLMQGRNGAGKGITGLRTLAFQSSALTGRIDLSPPPHLGEHAGEICETYLDYPAAKIAVMRKGKIML
ncbi:MAG: CoA transferase [Calditrichae bacterium]|nr:CoA transferase [Calditrichia bacterium]